MNNILEKLVAATATVIILLGLLAILGIALVFQGFVLSYLWVWFVVPLGIPAIGIAHAIAIIMVANLILRGRTKIDERPPEEKIRTSGKEFGVILVSWCIALGFGYCLSFLV
jgi:hypothetical protein